MQKNNVEKKSYVDLWLVLIVVLVVLALYKFYPRKTAVDTKPHEDVLELNVKPIEPRDVKISNKYIGFVTPINAVDITSYINGYLEDVMVKGGEEVEAGDTLIVIKQDEYKANLDQAKAQIMSAQANLTNLQAYYNRIKKAGSKAVSKSEVDAAKAQFLSAQAAVAEAKANYALAKVNYDYTVIQAPISGIIGNVDLTKGDYVSPASGSLLKLIQYNPIRVVFSITDKEYLDEMAKNPGNLYGGDSIQIRLSNGKIFAPKGQFKYFGNELNRETNSLAVYADFENADKMLVANAYVDVLIERMFEGGVVVKQNLVTLSPDGNYVYVVNGDKLNKQVVDIVTTKGNDYVLRNTFKSGDLLVLDKINRINPDQKIKVNVAGTGKADAAAGGEKK